MEKERTGAVRKALKGKGFLIALCVSFAAVGLSTYFAYNSAIAKITDGETKTELLGFDEGGAIAAGAEAVGVEKDEPSEDAAATQEAEPVNSFIAPKPQKQLPVEGEVLNPFSNGELVKSKTLGVWKTHDGVDLSAAEGTEVKAMTDGTVSQVYNDPLWGVCVEIDHGDGVVGYYMNLGENVPVSAGAEVGAGTVIGSAGRTAEVELAEEPHVHFAVKKNGQWIDPTEFVKE